MVTCKSDHNHSDKYITDNAMDIKVFSLKKTKQNKNKNKQ